MNEVSFGAALLVEGECRNLTPAVLVQETWRWVMFEWGAFTEALVRGEGGGDAAALEEQEELILHLVFCTLERK